MSSDQSNETDFLDEINGRLPSGVDWKQGAITYLREVVMDGGPSVERFHLVKPFVGGPDYSTFWTDAFHFLDLVKAMDLPHQSRIIDVGCGPGWTVHWLCKLGHSVVGCDISAELLDVAEQRMKADPFPPYVERPFDYSLSIHDVENSPLDIGEPADAAVFESTLHHFYNPVATLRNIAADLKPDGIIGVVEAAAPPIGSEWDEANVELMTRYHTIERPYTRDQLLTMLELAGFDYCEFYRPVNGLFRQQVDEISALRTELAKADNVNILIASRTRAGLERIVAEPGTVQERRTGVEFLDGFHGEESAPDGRRFRWAEARALISIRSEEATTLRVSTRACPDPTQHIYALADGAVVAELELSPRHPDAELRLPAGTRGVVELQAKTTFSPAWDGSADVRTLAFTVDVPPQH